MRKNSLQLLAERAGIEVAFEDAWGKQQTLSGERIRRLLAALGIAARNDREVRASLDELAQRPWRRALAPVLVRREHEALQVPLVSAENSTGMLAWRVEEEGGRLHQGRVAVDALAIAARTELAGKRLVRRVLTLSLSLPRGYHRLSVQLDDDPAAVAGEARLIVVPGSCYIPPALAAGGRTWGFATQLYALRSQRNWGIGDFTDWLTLVDGAHELGAGIIGVNPLHAPFLASPRRASPYAATSRLFLNPLYLDMERVPDFAECASARAHVSSREFQDRLQRSRDAVLVDYAAVAQCKLEVLELLHDSFVANHFNSAGQPTSARGEAFRSFQREHGGMLRDYALYEALTHDPACTVKDDAFWTHWDARYKDPRAAGALAFERSAAQRVAFYAYLQWITEEQLRAVADRCRERGMAAGIYLDLAVGVARDGADVWADQQAYIAQATVGAPPDIWNPMGQGWGLPPLHPGQLQEQGYAPFVAVLRANMRHAGALRIDHILALMRLYWIPGGAPSEGGYVSYPLDDLLGIVALESHRNRCLVIGEDLGTVPPELRERLQSCGILSYRLLYFEQDEDGAFLPPAAYPRVALATVTTHDLPTLPGYWAAHDLRVRSNLGLFPSPDHERDSHAQRQRDRAALLEALRNEGLWPKSEEGPSQYSAALVEAVYRFLARSPAIVLMVHFEDILGELEQANLPGTVDEHPNWQRKLPLDLAELLSDPRLLSLARCLNELRPARVDVPGPRDG